MHQLVSVTPVSGNYLEVSISIMCDTGLNPGHICGQLWTK